MSDWSLPTLSSLYTDFLSYLSGRLNDVATMFNSAPTSQPDKSIRLVRSGSNIVRFQESQTSVWTNQILAVAGGGTGSGTAAGARTALGLGTIATQNSNSVTITGGSVSSSTLSGLVAQANLGTGSDASGSHFLADDQTYKSVSPHYTNLTKSAGYVVTNADVLSGTIVRVTGTTTITLPAISSTIEGYPLGIVNAGSGIVTVARGGSDTIGLKTSILLYPTSGSTQGDSVLLTANTSVTDWTIQAFRIPGRQLIHTGAGTSASAVAANLDTFTLPTLTVKDKIFISCVVMATTAAGGTITVQDTTDTVKLGELSEGAGLPSPLRMFSEVTIRVTPFGGANKDLLSMSTTVDSTLGFVNTTLQITKTTAWTTAFAIALRTSGVTATGLLTYAWEVYIDWGE